MDISQQVLTSILHTNEIPPSVVKLAGSYKLQSSTVIPLKPAQEPARMHICCVLAVEKLGESLDLPQPDTRKPPIPPSQYAKLLGQFRAILIAPKTPRKSRTTTPQQSPQKLDTPGRTPRRRGESPQKSPAPTPRRSTRKRIDFGELDDLAYEDNEDDEDAELGDLKLDFEGEDEPVTPRKRVPTGARAGSPSPRKSPRRAPGPESDSIDTIGAKMGLERATIDVVLKAFEQYRELVKDRWELVYGLFAVVSDRAEPRPGSEHERKLSRAMYQVAPEVYIDTRAAVQWAEKILTGQTWLAAISQKPEPQPKLIGAAGGWGLGVEFNLIPLDTESGAQSEQVDLNGQAQFTKLAKLESIESEEMEVDSAGAAVPFLADMEYD